jgi:hypothetical protein
MALLPTYVIPPATAEVAIRQALTFFVRGPLAPHADSLDVLWRRLINSHVGTRLKFRRSIADVSWQSLAPAERAGEFTRLFDLRRPVIGCRGVEFAERSDDPLSTARVRIVDLATVNGVERASHVRILFDDAASRDQLVSLAEWLLGHVPVWWGSAGFEFDYVAGPSYTAYHKIARLAKRYWCVDLQDMLLLEWDALRGISSVNWLTLVGNEFAKSKELNLDELDAEKRGLETHGVFQRRGNYGVVLAAGPKPIKGDINIGEDLEPYVAVARRLRPLLLAEQLQLFGPFIKPEIQRAWLGRFGAPRAWLESDVGTS